MRELVSGLTAAALLWALPATATTTRIATRAAWEAAVGAGFVTEDFESLPLQVVPAGGGTIAATWFDIVVPENHGDIGIFDRDGSRVFEGDLHGCDPCTVSGSPGDPYKIFLEFHQPIFAFAVDLLYVEDDDEDITETIRFATPEAAYELPAMSFLGLVSDVAFTTVELRVSDENYWAIFDIDRVSALVPEPSTGLLVASGFAGFSLAARRRRHRSAPAR